jgi:hypothetical protein
MPDAQNQAERYRHLAEEYRRLTATSSSTEMRGRYRRMAEHYSSLAEVAAAEASVQRHENGEYSL